MLLLVLDPNICLAASLGHPPSEGLLEDITENRAYVWLGLDADEAALRQDYERLLPQLAEEPRKWLQAILSGEVVETRDLPAPIAQSKSQLFSELGCDTPVEPHLIALSAEEGREASLLVVGKEYPDHPEWRRRGVHEPGVVEQLRDRLGSPNLRIWDAVQARRAITDYVSREPCYPATELELHDFLSRHRCQETDQLEFKQPAPSGDPDGPYLTKSILTSAMEAVCALSNSYGGKVLIGIHEDHETKQGRIEGFVPKYKNRSYLIVPKTDDELVRICIDTHFAEFQPHFDPSELRVCIIKLANDRRVLVFDVKKSGVERTFRGKRFYRYGTETRCV